MSQRPAQRLDDNAALTGDSKLDALSSQWDSRHSLDLSEQDGPSPVQASATSAQRAAHRATVAAAGNGAGRAVLVVDSSAIARKFLAHKLQAVGYEVHIAEQGERALEMIQREDYAIVFLEVTLDEDGGGPDGLRLCRSIKQKPDHPRGKAPAVVMVTGLTGSTDRVRGSLAGCDAYLTKPLPNDEFLVTLALVDPLFK
jgi:two-component system, cell cycle response regulator